MRTYEKNCHFKALGMKTMEMLNWPWSHDLINLPKLFIVHSLHTWRGRREQGIGSIYVGINELGQLNGWRVRPWSTLCILIVVRLNSLLLYSWLSEWLLYAEPYILCPWAPICSTWVPNVDQMGAHWHKCRAILVCDWYGSPTCRSVSYLKSTYKSYEGMKVMGGWVECWSGGRRGWILTWLKSLRQLF